jgi:hypothetical protein
MGKNKVGVLRSEVGMPGGKVYCPYNDDECRCGEFCITSVWSTPRNPASHARALRRVVDKCATHKRQGEMESED